MYVLLLLLFFYPGSPTIPRASPVSVYLFPGERSKSGPSILQTVDSELDVAMATEAQADMMSDDASGDSTDNDDFCILEAPGMGIPVSFMVLSHTHHLLILIAAPDMMIVAYVFTHTHLLMGLFTAQGWGARGDSAVGGADQGEGQSFLAASRQLRPSASTQPLPSASEQGGAAGDLRGVAPLRRQRLWQQAHVRAHPARKQVR